MADPEIDEVALNVLLAEGMDVPTSVAASIRDRQPRAVTKYKPMPLWLKIVTAIVGVAVGVGWGILWR